MHPDFATSRGGHWKGCRCHGCGRSLKMVHIPCCVSITMVTCLRQTEQGGGERCRDVATWSLFFPVREKLTVTRVDRFPYQLGIALVKRDRISPHVCMWASFANTVWRNSRWGCRSVSLKSFLVLLFFFPAVSVESPETKMKLGVDQHIKCQGLVKKALNLHHYSSSSGEMVRLIQTISIQLWEKWGFCSGVKSNETCIMSLRPFITFIVISCLYGIPLVIFELHNVQLSFQNWHLETKQRESLCLMKTRIYQILAPPTLTLPFSVFVMSRSANQQCTKGLLSTAHYGTVPERA